MTDVTLSEAELRHRASKHYAQRAEWYGGYAVIAIQLALDTDRYPNSSMTDYAVSVAVDALHFAAQSLLLESL